MLSRLATLAVCLALIAARLAEPLHLAFAQHAICAEHGEVVERPEARHAGDPARAGIGAGSAEIARTSGHDHCLTAQSLRTAGAGARPQASVRTPASATTLAIPPRLAYVRDPRRVLSDSPKASPPRAA